MTFRLQLDVRLKTSKMSEIRRTAGALLQDAVCADEQGNPIDISITEVTQDQFTFALREVLHRAMEESQLLNKLSIEVADISAPPVDQVVQ